MLSFPSKITNLVKIKYSPSFTFAGLISTAVRDIAHHMNDPSATCPGHTTLYPTSTQTAENIPT